MEHQQYHHETVLLEEAVQALDIKPEGIYVDCTMGGAGHARLILSRLGPKGKLICFDQDSDAWSNTPDDKRVILVKENFRYLARFLSYYGHDRVDGILADIGVSSFQFDTADRGFSIRFDAPLDMRMDDRGAMTAADIVSGYSEQELHRMFEKNGEVRNARTLAKVIVEGRKNRRVERISDFKALIDSCVMGKPHKYMAQVFQALRIEVNEELVILKEFLEQTAGCLNAGGRLAVITFHSLEDKIVKHFMKNGTLDTEKPEEDPFGFNKVISPFRILKDVLPGEEELKRNTRSSSARLRIAERK